jgi:putative membrane protein
VDASQLPTLNAMLNTTAALLLVAGYRLIRAGDKARHKAVMLSALGVSAAFLASYLYYHAHVGTVRFQRTGWIRPVYFSILTTHTILAALVAPLALITAWRALRGRYGDHRRIARWTLPIWLYVSVTGVAVYWMLYRL